jgi:predicted amidohydrolase YtcJ
MEAFGTAAHAFLAADDPQRSREDRLEMAAGLIERHRILGALEPAEFVELGDRLWRWVRDRFGNQRTVHTEWPLGLKLESGTLVLGSSDLLVESGDAVAIIDHKSFGLTTAASRAEALAGQLGCYADAVVRARPGKHVSRWVHLPVEGAVIEVV